MAHFLSGCRADADGVPRAYTDGSISPYQVLEDVPVRPVRTRMARLSGRCVLRWSGTPRAHTDGFGFVLLEWRR